jgi:CheY-like chemotaxis protein
MSKVLIVEDNPTVVNLYRNALRSAGFSVQAVNDGAAVADALTAFDPDAVLLDLVLPSVDGLTLLRQMRSDARFTTLPVIVFSNTYTNDRLNEIWEAGATQVMSKASSTPKLVTDAVRAAVASRPPRP